MTKSMSYRLTSFIVTYLFFSCFVVYFTAELLVSASTESRTKLLLQNIRTHLAEKVQDDVHQKDCKSMFCKSAKSKKVDKNEEKSEESTMSPKPARDYHKPLFKAQKSILKKSEKDENVENPKLFNFKRNDLELKKGSKVDHFKFKKSVKPFAEPLKIFETKNVTRKIFLPLPVKMVKSETNIKLKSDLIKNVHKVEGKYKIVKRHENVIKGSKTDFEKKKLKSAKIKSIKKEEKGREEKYQEEDNLDFIFSKEIFFLALDSDAVNTELCRKHSQVYLKQLKKFKIWALMMYDASAKIPSGILQGNGNQLGDFDECLSVNAIFKNSKLKKNVSSGIKGKYCLANIDVSTNSENKNLQAALSRMESFSFIKSTIYDPGHFIPKFTTINWGLCVPSACPAEDVENFIKSKLKTFNGTSGIMFDIIVKEDNCVKKEDLKMELEATTYMCLIFYVIIITIAIYATYLDAVIEKIKKLPFKEEIEKVEESCRSIDDNEKYSTEAEDLNKSSYKEKMKNFIIAFSLKKNLKMILDVNESKDSIHCIYGIKSIFTIMLYFAHKTIPLGMIPFSNRIFLTKLSNETTTTLLRTSIIYTDSFLLISGVLLSYNLSQEINEKGKISWIKKFLSRYIRLTPALFAVTLFYAYIWPQLGSGPLWNLIVKKNAELCQKYMWRNLLYIQNLFEFEKMCAPQTHQLALDMQLSLLAPFFVYLLYKYDKVGIGILQALFLFSSIMRYISTSNNNLSIVIYHGMPVSQLYRTANLLYGQSLHRASPYILGTILGYYLKKYKEEIEVPKAFVALGWIIAFAFGFYSIVSPSHLASINYKYNVHEAAQYAALSPVAWSLALAWLIVACHLGYGGKLNEILSSKSLLVFSRISYSVYLTQFLVFFYEVGVVREPEMFTLIDCFSATEFFIITGISVIVTLLFDMPMADIKNYVVNEIYKKRISSLAVRETFEDSDQDRETEEIIPWEESQENMEDRDPNLKKSEESEAEEEEEEEDDDDDDDDDEVDGDINDGVIGTRDFDNEVENIEMQPLRRSTRILFDNENEDKEWFVIDNGAKINE